MLMLITKDDANSDAGGHLETQISVCKMNTRETYSCTIKVYPRVVHYLKDRNIGIELPPNNQGIQDKVGAN